VQLLVDNRSDSTKMHGATISYIHYLYMQYVTIILPVFVMGVKTGL